MAYGQWKQKGTAEFTVQCSAVRRKDCGRFEDAHPLAWAKDRPADSNSNNSSRNRLAKRDKKTMRRACVGPTAVHAARGRACGVEFAQRALHRGCTEAIMRKMPSLP